MKLLNTFIILIFLTGQLYSQPGGGGGLLISNIYNNKYEKLNILTDTTLKLRTFNLLRDSIYQETFIREIFVTEKGKMRINQEYFKFGPFPKKDMNVDGYDNNESNQNNFVFGLIPTDDIDEDGYGDSESNQRIYIVYKKDTMIIDFIGVIGENGGGNSDRMDSLVIQHGYFKYKRAKEYWQKYFYKDYNENKEEFKRTKKLMHNGLTFHSVKLLSEKAYIEYCPDIDISFLHEENLPASYFLKRARYYFQNNHINSVFPDINKAIEKNNGKMDCETLYLLTDTYTKVELYGKAIEYISQAIKCKRYNWDPDNEANNYRTRALLFIKENRFNEALRDYDSLVSVSRNELNSNIERSTFKMKYLNDYSSAINDLKKIIAKIPDDHLSDRPHGGSEYCDIYFTLGLAEYYKGERKSAYKHWLKAEEFGTWQFDFNYKINHYDSIIQKYPKAPELYFARGITHLKKGSYEMQGKQATECFVNSIKDFNKAERLGLTDFRINMFKANVLNKMKTYYEAKQQINIAISKDSKDPRCFLLRYYIRGNSGERKWNNKSDSDWVKYEKLCNSWKFEK